MNARETTSRTSSSASPPVPSDRNPLAVSLGMGVDSVALLVGLHARDVRPDVVLHAVVGNEWPETDAYRPVMNAWLASVGFPAVVEVRYRVQRPKHGHYDTLEQNCLVNATLPSLAFGGRKACSAKWKGAPLDRAVREMFADHVRAGGRVDRMIGYDAGLKDSRRCGTEESGGPWRWIYPLRDWGWDRERCVAEIRRAGLAVPHKSACWFCPATSQDEVLELASAHPDLARRAVSMEDRARPNLVQIRGLWGRDRKGTRDGRPRPGSWREFLAARAPHVLPEAGPLDGVRSSGPTEQDAD